jgi:hypothetical protein
MYLKSVRERRERERERGRELLESKRGTPDQRSAAGGERAARMRESELRDEINPEGDQREGGERFALKDLHANSARPNLEGSFCY